MKYTNGNLLDLAEQGKFDIIVQGCNCQNTMNSGIAKQIRERYPKAYLADQVTQKGDLGKLGCFTQAYINGTRLDSAQHPVHYSFTVLNAYTQAQYGYDQKQYVDYDAVGRVFKQIKLLYDMNPMSAIKIGIPMIGTTRGGGDWTVIESIIEGLNFSDLTVVCYDGEGR